MNSIADTEAELNRSMTADPDHARALEVLQQDVRALAVLRDDILLMTSGKARALVALYAAAVPVADAVQRALVSGRPWFEFLGADDAARIAKALAAVAKAVLP